MLRLPLHGRHRRSVRSRSVAGWISQMELPACFVILPRDLKQAGELFREEDPVDLRLVFLALLGFWEILGPAGRPLPPADGLVLVGDSGGRGASTGASSARTPRTPAAPPRCGGASTPRPERSSARAPSVLGRSGLCRVVRGLPEGAAGASGSRIVSRSLRPLLLAGHERLLEHVDEHARPHADVGDRERRVGAASHERPDLIGELDVGALRVADPGEPHPRRRGDRASPSPSGWAPRIMPSRDSIRQPRTPVDAQRDPLCECRVVAHPSWEASTGRPPALEPARAIGPPAPRAAAADITSSGAGVPVHSSKDSAACSQEMAEPAERRRTGLPGSALEVGRRGVVEEVHHEDAGAEPGQARDGPAPRRAADGRGVDDEIDRQPFHVSRAHHRDRARRAPRRSTRAAPPGPRRAPPR